MDNTNIQEEKRLKQMAILKASNELLRQSKEKALNKITDPLKKSEIKRAFEKAITENYEEGESYLQANSNDIEQSTYRDVDEAYVEKYNNRLEKKGLTDEELHRKGVATVSQKEEKSGWKLNRRRKSANTADNEEEIVRVTNEEEVMKSTMVSTDDELKSHITQKVVDENTEKKKKQDVREKAVSDIVDNIANKKVNVSKETNSIPKLNNKNDISVGQSVSDLKQLKSNTTNFDFDFSSIPSYVQYDIIPLPSKGECYPHKKDRIVVRYLTASEENIIASPNMYRDGNLIDVILSRVILDKDFQPNTLCRGDRDAIVLWLRANAYGLDFPVITTNPKDKTKQYNINLDLSQFKYNEFNLKGDENGYFTYKVENGDEIVFRFFTYADELTLKDKIVSDNYDINMYYALDGIMNLTNSLNNINYKSEEDKTEALACIEDLQNVLSEQGNKVETEKLYSESITEQMKLYTISVNGNDDRDYISKFIENMRSNDAYLYRKYVKDNTPGIDFSFEVTVPEADGGGRYTATFRYDDTIFINI